MLDGVQQIFLHWSRVSFVCKGHQQKFVTRLSFLDPPFIASERFLSFAGRPRKLQDCPDGIGLRYPHRVCRTNGCPDYVDFIQAPEQHGEGVSQTFFIIPRGECSGLNAVGPRSPHFP